jgi:hypothetical protein
MDLSTMGKYAYAGWPVLALAGLVASGYYAQRQARQTPLPGIPYRDAGAFTVFGDIHAMRDEHPDKRRKWLAELPSMLGAPVVQSFLEPLAQPWVIVSDFWEAVDITQRRGKDFDRAYRTFELFGIVIPEHHITMKTSDPRFQYNKYLVRNLRSPSFLSQVRGCESERANERGMWRGRFLVPTDDALPPPPNKVTTPRIYRHTLALVDLWILKADIAQGRPFEAHKDLWTNALDVIMGVAFGLDESRAAIGAEATHVSNFETKHGREVAGSPMGRPVEFGHAPLEAELQAFVTLTDAVAMSMRFPRPGWTHWLASVLPRYRHAVHTKDQMIHCEIDASIRRLVAGGYKDLLEGGDLQSSPRGDEIDERIECAMDQMILSELKHARKNNRPPEYHSKTVRDEVSLGGV